MAINQDLKALFPKNDVDSKYLLYSILNKSSLIINQGSGTTVKGIRLETLKSLPIEVPLIKEQQKIAAILSSVDEAIEKTEEIIEQTEKVKKGIMQELLTKGIGHTKFKSTEIGEVPESWEVKEIRDIGKVGTGSTPRRNEKKNFEGGKIPWVKTTEVNYDYIVETEEYVTDYAIKNSRLKLNPKNTILLAMYGQGITRGKCAILGISATTNQACATIQTNEEVYPLFLFYYLQNMYKEIRNLGHGSNQSNLNKSIVESIKIPLPDYKEQFQIGTAIFELDKKLKVEKQKVDKLGLLKQSLMQVLLTGKVRVKVD